MKKQIEHPRVFISYSWSGNEYEEKVMNFAKQLVEHGIEVIIDKWNINPGDETYSFMETNILDPDTDFVLMLIDNLYTEKANGRKGGVGAETQIISSEVYNKVDNNKFIPIIFERGKDGEIEAPTYLKSRFHIDLTKEDSEIEYMRLVKYIYGYDMYNKPELGTKPKFVDEDINSPSGLKFKVLSIKKDSNSFQYLSEEIKKSNLGEERLAEVSIEEKNKTILEIYNNSLEYRNALLEIFINKNKEKDFVDDVCDFYEDIKKWNSLNDGLKKEIWSSFVHESFIYLIAILFKAKQYRIINVFVTKSYFRTEYGSEAVNMNDYFYYYNYSMLKIAKNDVNKKEYLNGMAQIWMDNIYEPKITKFEFVQADVLSYNLSIILLEDSSSHWFPTTYIYGIDVGYNGVLKDFSIKLKSRYQIERFKEMFDVIDKNELQAFIQPMEKIFNDKRLRSKYLGSFHYADLILDYIKIDEIGSIN